MVGHLFLEISLYLRFYACLQKQKRNYYYLCRFDGAFYRSTHDADGNVYVYFDNLPMKTNHSEQCSTGNSIQFINSLQVLGQRHCHPSQQVRMPLPSSFNTIFHQIPSFIHCFTRCRTFSHIFAHHTRQSEPAPAPCSRAYSPCTTTCNSKSRSHNPHLQAAIRL